MSSTITALTSGGGLAMAGDTSGQLELKTNNGTTAVTISTGQVATFAADSVINGLTVGKGGGAVSTNTALGVSALTANTTGANNTAVGYASGSLLTTGSKNSILGAFSGNQGGLDIRTASNYIVLSDGDGNPRLSHQGNQFNIMGPDATNTGSVIFRDSSFAIKWRIVTDNNTWYLADADFSNYVYVSQNFTAWTFASDRRIKENIVDLDKGLDTILAIKPKRYNLINSGKEDIGFIAQDLKEVLPEAVSGTELPFNEADTPQEKAAKTLGISKETIIPVLVKAIQELNAKVDAQAAEIQALKGVA